MKYKIRHVLGWILLAGLIVAGFMPFEGWLHFLYQLIGVFILTALFALIEWLITSKEHDDE